MTDHQSESHRRYSGDGTSSGASAPVQVNNEPPAPDRPVIKQRRSPWAIVGLIVIAVLLFAAVFEGVNLLDLGSRLRDADARTAQQIDDKLKEANQAFESKFNDLKANTAKEKKALQDTINDLQNKAKNSGSSSTGSNANKGGSTNGGNAQSGSGASSNATTAEQMTAVDKQLKAGGLNPSNGTFNIDWAKNDALNPGAMEFCKAPAHTAASLVDRLNTCPLALSTYMKGAGITRDQAMDVKAWVPWQSNTKLHYAKGMSFDNNGNVQWGKDFVDPAGAVLWINTHAVHPFFLRDLCLNSTKPPVATMLPATFAPAVQAPAPVVKQPVITPVVPKTPIITIVQKFCKPGIPVGDVRCNEVQKFCKPGIPVGDRRCEEVKQFCKPGIPVGDNRCKEVKHECKPGIPVGDDRCKEVPNFCKPGIPVGDKRCNEVPKFCKPGIPVGDDRCKEVKHECKPGVPVGDNRCDAKDPAKNPQFPADHDLAKGDTPKTPKPQPLPNPIDPTTPITAPAPPVVKTPGANPAPNPAPVPAPEAPAPAPATPGQVHVDPDDAVPATPAAATPVVAQPAVATPAAPVAVTQPVVAQEPAAAPVTQAATPTPAAPQIATQVASAHVAADAPAPTTATPAPVVATTSAATTVG